MSPFSIVQPKRVGPFLFSCEHASNKLPNHIVPTKQDKHFLDTHWGVDIGVAGVTRHLIASTQSQGIFAEYSRLWVDLNRSLDRTDLIRTETEGYPLSFNQELAPEQVQQRLEVYYRPYHEAFDQLVEQRVAQSAPVLLVSMHSFTPVWNGQVRTMDIGVLFDKCEDLGSKLATLIGEQELVVELNQPYTGRNGLMFSVEDKGLRHQCPHLEIEINQALICTPDRQQRVARKLHTALMMVYPELVNF